MSGPIGVSRSAEEELKLLNSVCHAPLNESIARAIHMVWYFCLQLSPTWSVTKKRLVAH